MHHSRDDEELRKAIEFGIDITLLEENLRLTPMERLEGLVRMVEFSEELKRAKALKEKSLNV
jgi:hypothetical protein